jgi:hypothetical protein
MCRLQLRNRNNSSRTMYHGVKLLTQKMRACQSSALMNGPPDVSDLDSICEASYP